MPIGKASISGASGSSQLQLVEEVTGLCYGLHRRKGMPEPTSEEIEKCGHRIHEAIRSYLAYQATPMLTATQRKRILNKVVTAAGQLQRQLELGNDFKTVAEKLLKQLATDVNTRDVVHKHLRRAGYKNGLIGLQRKLEEWCEWDVDDEARPEVSAMLGCICTLQDRTDDRPHWRDPLMVNLVLDLAVIWQKLTGFSPRTVDTEIGDHAFAEWMNQLFESVRIQQKQLKMLPQPPVTRGAVEDILARLIFEKTGD